MFGVVLFCRAIRCCFQLLLAASWQIQALFMALEGSYTVPLPPTLAGLVLLYISALLCDSISVLTRHCPSCSFKLYCGPLMWL